MSMMDWNEITDFVLKHDYGCNVCAGVCQRSVFKMNFNKYGEYRTLLGATRAYQPWSTFLQSTFSTLVLLVGLFAQVILQDGLVE